MDVDSRHKYLALLIALVVLVALYPLMREVFDTRILFDALVTAVFLTAVQSVFPRGWSRILALILGIPTVVGLWAGYVLPGVSGLAASVIYHGFAVAFIGFTVAMILKNIHAERSISSENIRGAFCGYILVGLLFAHLYCIIETAQPGSFSGPHELPSITDRAGHLHFVLTYFSFVTLTTVGFGDIAPVRDAARGMAVAEAIVGQFYLVVLVAELIGKRVSQVTQP